MKQFGFHNPTRTEVSGGRFIERPDGLRLTEIMAEASGYAMIRRSGCIPYVIRSQSLVHRFTAPNWVTAKGQPVPECC